MKNQKQTEKSLQLLFVELSKNAKSREKNKKEIEKILLEVERLQNEEVTKQIKKVSAKINNQNVLRDKNACAEHVKNAKEANKMLSFANREVTSLSGVCRLIKEFAKEYNNVLIYHKLDAKNISPKMIKDKWNKDFIIDGKLFENKKFKSSLYNEEEAVKYGDKYLFNEYLSCVCEVESFTVNKVLKYIK